MVVAARVAIIRRVRFAAAVRLAHVVSIRVAAAPDRVPEVEADIKEAAGQGMPRHFLDGDGGRAAQAPSARPRAR